MLAAREGRADVVKTFLEQKDIDVNIQDQSGITALILAVQFK